MASVGVDLGGTQVRAASVTDNRMGPVAARLVRAQGTSEEVFDDLCAAIDAVVDERVEGIGVGVPSLVEAESGTILDTTNIPSWKRVPLRPRLEARYGCPVRIDNDANCFALGERYFGEGHDCDNFVGLIIGTGLGAGIVSNGRLHSGVSCGAGEFGLIPYLDGVVEQYASGQFFRRFGREGGELAEAAERGDAEALRIFVEYGRHLGFVVSVILYALAPRRIILGGSVSRSFPHFREALLAALDGFAYPSVRDALELAVSKVEHGAILGAASLLRA
jgi:glucokinase